MIKPKDKIDLLCGYTYIPTMYSGIKYTPLTKKEKRQIFYQRIKEIAIEILWFILFCFGSCLFASSLGVIVGMGVKWGMQ